MWCSTSDVAKVLVSRLLVASRGRSPSDLRRLSVAGRLGAGVLGSGCRPTRGGLGRGTCRSCPRQELACERWRQGLAPCDLVAEGFALGADLVAVFFAADGTGGGRTWPWRSPGLASGRYLRTPTEGTWELPSTHRLEVFFADVLRPGVGLRLVARGSRGGLPGVCRAALRPAPPAMIETSTRASFDSRLVDGILRRMRLALVAFLASPSSSTGLPLSAESVQEEVFFGKELLDRGRLACSCAIGGLGLPVEWKRCEKL